MRIAAAAAAGGDSIPASISLHLLVELRREVDRLVGPDDGFVIDDDVDALGLRERLDLRRRLLEEILDQLRALRREIALELDVDLLQLDELLLEVLALLRVDLGLENRLLLVEIRVGLLELFLLLVELGLLRLAGLL